MTADEQAVTFGSTLNAPVGATGHVHNCDPHAALNREWSDVIESASMPNCPFVHGGMWIDTPRDL